MAIEKVRPETLAKAHGYSHAVVATGSRVVYTSGQTPLDQEGNLVGEGPDYRAQGRQAASNLYAALAAAGASAADIARLNIYVVDATEANLEELYAGLGEAGAEAGAKSTATTVVGIAAIAIPGAIVEMDAIALID